MKYYPVIEIPYLSDWDNLHEACSALATAMLESLSGGDPNITFSDLVVFPRPDNTVIVRVAFKGTSPRILTSPLDAIVKLDTSLNRSLMATGLFEEFDVARRALRVSAVPPTDH